MDKDNIEQIITSYLKYFPKELLLLEHKKLGKWYNQVDMLKRLIEQY